MSEKMQISASPPMGSYSVRLAGSRSLGDQNGFHVGRGVNLR
jgi:hypothetical protein